MSWFRDIFSNSTRVYCIVNEYSYYGFWPSRKSIWAYEVLPTPKPAPLVRDPKRFDDCGTYSKGLRNHGFDHLGGGAYGSVYGKLGKDRVIKVLRRPSEDGWFDYVKWANENGYGGSFAPKLFSYKYHKGHGKDDGYAVAVMERLASSRENPKHNIMRTMANYAVDNNPFAKDVLEQAQPGFGKFLEEMRSHFGRASYDLHGGNFMVRGDQLVLTDPIAGKVDLSRRRLRRADFEKAKLKEAA